MVAQSLSFSKPTGRNRGVSATTQDTKQAVVFLHGILGADLIHRLWPGFCYFRAINEELKAPDLSLHFPVVPSASSISRRAGVLQLFIDSVQADCIHLIAHSMGGGWTLFDNPLRSSSAYSNTDYSGYTASRFGTGSPGSEYSLDPVGGGTANDACVRVRPAGLRSVREGICLRHPPCCRPAQLVRRGLHGPPFR